MARSTLRLLLFWVTGSLLSGMLPAYAVIPTEGGIRLNQTRVNLETQPSMLAPMSTLTFTVSGSPLSAEWQTITDYGRLSTQCKQQIAQGES